MSRKENVHLVKLGRRSSLLFCTNHSYRSLWANALQKVRLVSPEILGSFFTVVRTLATRVVVTSACISAFAISHLFLHEILFARGGWRRSPACASGETKALAIIYAGRRQKGCAPWSIHDAVDRRGRFSRLVELTRLQEFNANAMKGPGAQVIGPGEYEISYIYVGGRSQSVAMKTRQLKTRRHVQNHGVYLRDSEVSVLWQRDCHQPV